MTEPTESANERTGGKANHRHTSRLFQNVLRSSKNILIICESANLGDVDAIDNGFADQSAEMPSAVRPTRTTMYE